MVDYAIAVLPVWFTLDAFGFSDAMALGGAVRGGLRAPVIVLTLLLPQFFPRTDAVGLHPTVALFLLATVYLLVLLFRTRRAWITRMAMGTVVWLGLVTLGYLADKLAGGLMVYSRGGPFRFYLQLDLFTYLIAHQILALAPAATLVSILHALYKRIRPGRSHDEKPVGTVQSS